jgi:hypothetical protein
MMGGSGLYRYCPSILFGGIHGGFGGEHSHITSLGGCCLLDIFFLRRGLLFLDHNVWGKLAISGGLWLTMMGRAKALLFSYYDFRLM